MNLKKWSPLHSTRSDVFRTMEDNHNSLLLPTKPAVQESKPPAASLTEIAGVLPKLNPPPLQNPSRPD